ncbi:vitelliform macular dystrophy 2-like protein 3 [Aphelenchoides avenae]|nr:vitelliform macular dystrophy 2-like protein 3 [Aphelenchus avenae]
MTVTYTLEVSTARFWGFAKLLGRWKGSIYKLMYREMLTFLIAYYAIAFFYRYAMSDLHQRHFEELAIYCREFTSVVPITFVLGFYVTFVVGRWWQQYCNIAWPDNLAIEISAYVQGNDERGRMIRRTLVRYINILSVLTFQCTSTVIKKRFPTLDHMVEAGILTPEEKAELENVETPHGIWWVPAQWFGQLAMIARKEGRIHDDFHLSRLIDDMLAYRGMCGMVWSYDWISVPLSYTQVVAIAVYSFFVSCLFGRQYLLHSNSAAASGQAAEHIIDYYVPIFTIFQFFFYVGWLKVAESMISGYGEDDDDFNTNWIIDRNVQVSYLMVDKMYRRIPKVTKDVFWDNVEPELPYTQAASRYRGDPFYGSTTAMDISEKKAEWDMPDQMPPIDEEAGMPANITVVPSVRRKRTRSKVSNRIVNGRAVSVDSTNLKGTLDGLENAEDTNSVAMESDAASRSSNDDAHSCSSRYAKKKLHRRSDVAHI